MKISRWGLNALLAVNLMDTPIFEELLSRVDLRTNEDGKILDFQVDNIKASVKVALRLSIEQDRVISGKLKRALMSLLDYGTEASSNNIREFLKSPESQSPLILTNLSANSHVLVLGNALLPFLKNKGTTDRGGAFTSFNSLMRQTVQDFSA